MTPAAPAHILVVDDVEKNVRLLVDVLSVRGYRVSSALSGEAALERIESDPPDLLLLDVMMPGLSGYDVCRRLRAEPRHAILPIVLVTALDPATERIKGLEAGADDFLGKPVSQAELMARVRSLLRIKALYDEVQRQRAELDSWNRQLQQRVAAGVEQMERLGRLKRFFSPALAEAIVSGGASDPLRSHRREIVVVCLELRGYAALVEALEPDTLIGLLREYHAAMGALIQAYDGTVERFTGDAVMVFFNDPEPVPDAADRALRMALQMQQALRTLAAGWQRHGHVLQLCIGVARGMATLGAIGFEGRLDYGAIGNVTHLAHRLCGEARGGEILAAQEVVEALSEPFHVEPVGAFILKGHAQPMHALRVLGTPMPLAVDRAPPGAGQPCHYGRAELRPAERRLLVDGEAVPLGARAFDLLLVLIEHNARVVSKGELLERVWPGLVVEENNLQVQISALRKVLGAEAIATIPGRGYRFTLRPTA
ncbi:MAG: hypothetical protein RLY71_4512 [Pseudomonadota bacterium]|jgi:DNA-binding response OmpR family regulator